jgi:coproporphyrinogen III oxidase
MKLRTAAYGGHTAVTMAGPRLTTRQFSHRLLLLRCHGPAVKTTILGFVMQQTMACLIKGFICAGALLAFPAPVVYSAADDVRLEQLPPDHRELAEWLNAFVDRMDEVHFGRVGKLNGELIFEDRNFTTVWSEHEVRVTRGRVMEKAGRLYSMGKKQRAERGGREIVWSRFYALDMHPKTPLVGMLHAAIVLQFFGDGSSYAGGWLGTMPGAKIDEDLSFLSQATENYFAANEVDLTIYRQLVCKGTDDTVAQYRRLPACVGASFYGPPIFPGDTGKSLKFIAGFYDLFVGAYMDIVEKRVDDPFTEADILAQDKMRKRWLTDQMLSDPYSSVQIPFEVHSFWNAAPTIKF